MRNFQTISGKIVELAIRDTRYGLRATGILEQTNHATGEVTEHAFKGWADAAEDIRTIGTGGGCSLKGSSKTDDGAPVFLAKQVSAVRFVDPAEVDVSAYL